MKPKTYTIELTADQLDQLTATYIRGDIQKKVVAAAEQARADREGPDLRLPWGWSGGHPDSHHYLVLADGWHAVMPSAEAAALASAAPLLLEAVRAAKRLCDSWDLGVKYCYDGALVGAVDRALRKAMVPK